MRRVLSTVIRRRDPFCCLSTQSALLFREDLPDTYAGGSSVRFDTSAPLRLVLYLKAGILALILAVTPGAASAQESLNTYYRFPLSIGGGYVPLSAVGDVGRRAAVNEIAGEIRAPLPGLPVLQPFITGGALTFDSDEAAAPSVLGGSLAAGATLPEFEPRDVWDHAKLYAALGIGYAHRISREFEVAIDAFAGAGHSSYDRRFVTDQGEWYPAGSPGVLGGLSGRITLSPAFNMAIHIAPSLRYTRTVGPLSDFDGVYFGLGIEADYRFGSDPDAPATEVRAIRFGEVNLPPIFAAMQSHYVSEPVTTVALTNVERAEITDVQVSFHQPGFMDSPTLSARVNEIAAGATVEVPILASFNSEVFFTNGVVPLNGEIVVSYRYRGRPVTQRQGVTYDLHDRNALTWDDDRKVAAFITSSDSAVANYASFIRASGRDDLTDYLPDNLEYAMQVYHALASLGLVYQPDPSSPFAEVQDNTFAVDTVSLPRETLVNITGDCDDITVLYTALLESAGVPTGFVTTPGHIYAAVDTGVPPREFARVHADRDMTVEIDGSLWILVEITLIGQSGFLEAWRTGMEQWLEYEERTELRAFHKTSVAQSAFRPVGLRETDLGLQYGQPDGFLAAYRSDRGRIARLLLAPLREQATQRASARTWNRYGIAAAQLGERAEAEAAFERAATLGRSDISPQVNLGSLRYLQGDFDGALTSFRQAERRLRDAGESDSRGALLVYLNLARTLYELERYDEAGAYVTRAEEIDQEEADRYRYIAQAGGTGGTRAAGVSAPSILFMEGGDE